ncbi:MAG: WhiB family transcriptional regulator [Propionicimonas sp.]|nr:WhiB family transcriptional regulator [Propionicimonas sp.]
MPSLPAPCVTAAEVFQHPLVEEPAASGRPDLQARQLLDQATRLCASCPLADRCLYDAVVEHDVAGVAGGTTPSQRLRIRRLLGIRVEPEDLGEFTGTTRERGRLTSAEVMRLRRAEPDASLETIAERLGCSLSTVKRDLRQARADAPVVAARAPRPPLDAVLAARAVVAGTGAAARVA